MDFVKKMNIIWKYQKWEFGVIETIFLKSMRVGE